MRQRLCRFWRKAFARTWGVPRVHWRAHMWGQSAPASSAPLPFQMAMGLQPSLQMAPMQFPMQMPFAPQAGILGVPGPATAPCQQPQEMENNRESGVGEPSENSRRYKKGKDANLTDSATFIGKLPHVRLQQLVEALDERFDSVLTSDMGAKERAVRLPWFAWSLQYVTKTSVGVKIGRSLT